jgi:prepilin-type N-terminal cleavage/methylation domain-containing protein
LAFTLVELLVVIAIIGILAALITAAGVSAIGKAQQSRIKTEMDQMAMALQTYKDTNGSYPSNCQVDGDNSMAPLREAQVLVDIRRHFKQAFPRHREPDTLIAALAGMTPNGVVLPTGQALQGGMSAGEALVFWLGGFSSDPKYPISGEGGPSYRIDNLIAPADARNSDPIANRKWVYPFEVTRLQPRAIDGYFDDSAQAGQRFIEYTIRINGVDQTRRINFWQYVPAKSQQPYLYFDVSRHPAAEVTGSQADGPFDPPAATDLNPNALHIHAIKMRSESAGAASPLQFANQDKFQILHCGIDDAWDEEAFGKMSPHMVTSTDPDDYLLYPTGPFTGEVADTIVNFSESTLEASQP